jgi:pimeloyl-ACP methyl ester carboxylesterase
MPTDVPAGRGRAPRRVVRRVVVGLVLLAVLAYAAALVHLMLSETELIFRTEVAKADTLPPFPYTKIDLPRADGAAQFAWRIQAADDDTPVRRSLGEGGWVLFLHGNASTVASRMNVKHCARLRELGFNVLAPEYRGYNGLAGVPSETSVAEDARAAYDYLRTRERVPAERLIIFGWSLGAAIAVNLASQVDARGVILEGAPDSVVEIGQERYPMFPVRLIIRNPFNVVTKVGGIRAPLLFLHSPEDTVVPFVHGRRLFDAAPSPKTFVEVRGGHIEASEIDRAVFYGAITTFLSPSATPTLSR